MMKLEGKRPKCWSFVLERLSLTTIRHKAFKTHRKLIQEKYSALATANYKILWSTYFRCTKNLYLQLQRT